jgi:hypothetical protein
MTIIVPLLTPERSAGARLDAIGFPCCVRVRGNWGTPGVHRIASSFAPASRRNQIPVVRPFPISRCTCQSFDYAKLFDAIATK